MSNICNICKNTCYGEILLSCGHLFCYICLKTYTLQYELQCPVCKIELTIDLNNVTTETELSAGIYWLYAANYGNGWWCYNETEIKNIEKIYKDFLKRNYNSDIESDDEQDETVAKTKSTNQNDDSSVINTGAVTFDMIDYSSSESGDEQDNEDKLSTGTGPKALPDYTVMVGINKYLIDFENMKQININNPKKQRTILRIEIPDNITDIKKYMIDTLNIKGIGGVQFKKDEIANE